MNPFQNVLLGLLILTTAALNTAAQLLMKLGAGLSPLNLYLLGGVGLYGLSTILYIMVLSQFNLSIAYPIVIGLTVVLTTAAGMLLLRERVSLLGWFGVSLLILGIMAIAATQRVP